jgi:hypothetical protein
MHFTSLIFATILAAIPTAVAAVAAAEGEASILAGCCCGRLNNKITTSPFPGHFKKGILTPKVVPPKEALGCVRNMLSPKTRCTH